MHLTTDLVLDEIELSGEWEKLLVPMSCNFVELTGDNDWWWATDPDVTSRKVASLTREVLTTGKGTSTTSEVRFVTGDAVCWVKGTGKLYRKFMR